MSVGVVVGVGDVLRAVPVGVIVLLAVGVGVAVAGTVSVKVALGEPFGVELTDGVGAENVGLALAVVEGVFPGGNVGVFVPAVVGVRVEAKVAATVGDGVSVAVGVGPAGNSSRQKPPSTTKLAPAL